MAGDATSYHEATTVPGTGASKQPRIHYHADQLSLTIEQLEYRVSDLIGRLDGFCKPENKTEGRVVNPIEGEIHNQSQMSTFLESQTGRLSQLIDRIKELEDRLEI